jgi:kynurenine 3-monooxygenase
MPDKNSITIAGAGLVGALHSIYLSKRGFTVNVYERRADMRKNRIVAGRSINLALSDRGFRALEGVGIAEAIKEISIPMSGRMMHDPTGQLTFQPYGKENQAIYSVSRGGLNCKLMDLAEEHGVRLNFNHKCVDVNLEEGSAIFEHDGLQKKVISDLLIGADGAFSEVRNVLQRTPWFNYSQEYINYGYKELAISPDEKGNHRMERNALHIWPRGDFMLIALPNIDGSFTLTLFFPRSGPKSFESINTPEEILAFFQSNFPDIMPLIPDLLAQYATNPVSGMVIVKCFPWNWKDKVVLLGDSAHAIVPFFGQGMNCGFEDCTVFDQLLNDNQGGWQAMLDNFTAIRKPNADAIAELALRNFIEMRDRVSEPLFLLQKKIETRFNELHPDKWIPLYSMVTFSHVPYAEALKAGDRQESIMKQIMQLDGINENWESKEVEEEILKLL